MNLNISNKNSGKILFSRASLARTFFQRLKGFMFRGRISAEEALFFYQAPIIHTFLMRVPIDLIFLDRKMRVIRVAEMVGPGRIRCCWRSYCTIECSGNQALAKDISPGETLTLEEMH